LTEKKLPTQKCTQTIERLLY